MFEGILFIHVVLTCRCRAYLRIFLDSFCLNLFKKANKMLHTVVVLPNIEKMSMQKSKRIFL